MAADAKGSYPPRSPSADWLTGPVASIMPQSNEQEALFVRFVLYTTATLEFAWIARCYGVSASAITSKFLHLPKSPKEWHDELWDFLKQRISIICDVDEAVTLLENFGQNRNDPSKWNTD